MSAIDLNPSDGKIWQPLREEAGAATPPAPPVGKKRLRDRFSRAMWVWYIVAGVLSLISVTAVAAVLVNMFTSGYGDAGRGLWRLADERLLFQVLMNGLAVLTVVGPLFYAGTVSLIRKRDATMDWMGAMTLAVVAVLAGTLVGTINLPHGTPDGTRIPLAPTSWVEQQVDEQLGGEWTVVGDMLGREGSVRNEAGDIRLVTLDPTNGDENLLHVTVK